MIGIDTNILLRLLMDDDPEQHRLAREFVAARSSQAPAFVSFVVLAETVWTLRRVYRAPAADVSGAFRAFLNDERFVFEEAPFLRDLFRNKEEDRSDIADHLIACAASRTGCATVVTFDRKAARLVPGMALLS